VKASASDFAARINLSRNEKIIRLEKAAESHFAVAQLMLNKKSQKTA
jgi:hypothetical protein